MSNRILCAFVVTASLALLAGPAAASDSDSEPDLFGVLSTFVLNGLGPARTMEDIQREERQAAVAARAAAAAEEAAQKAASSSLSDAAAQEPMAAMPAPEALPESVPPVKVAKVEPAKVIPSQPKIDVIPPPPQARPRSESAKIAPPAVTLPPPEPLKSHIAATATVDQAIRLGGPSGLYGRRLMVD